MIEKTLINFFKKLYSSTWTHRWVWQTAQRPLTSFFFQIIENINYLYAQKLASNRLVVGVYIPVSEACFKEV